MVSVTVVTAEARARDTALGIAGVGARAEAAALAEVLALAEVQAVGVRAEAPA